MVNSNAPSSTVTVKNDLPIICVIESLSCSSIHPLPRTLQGHHEPQPHCHRIPAQDGSTCWDKGRISFVVTKDFIFWKQQSLTAKLFPVAQFFTTVTLWKLWGLQLPGAANFSLNFSSCQANQEWMICECDTAHRSEWKPQKCTVHWNHTLSIRFSDCSENLFISQHQNLAEIHWGFTFFSLFDLCRNYLQAIKSYCLPERQGKKKTKALLYCS